MADAPRKTGSLKNFGIFIWDTILGNWKGWDGNVGTTQLNGVPSDFSKQSQASTLFQVVKGNVNAIRIRPEILNEHVESSREAMDIVDVNTVVGQVFKASKTNIRALTVTLESAATFNSMDALATAGEGKAGTMEYSSDAALQLEYVKGGTALAVRSAYTDLGSVTQTGSYALKLAMDTLNDDWRVVLASTNLTGVTFEMDYANTEEWSGCKIYFFIGDGVNTKSFPMTIGAKETWQHFDITEDSMAVESHDDTATTPNMAAIIQMGFRVVDKGIAKIAYVDQITYQAGGGSVELELWDFGAALPASDGTVDYTASTPGQYTELGDRGIGAGIVTSSVTIELKGGKRAYHLDDFAAGVAPEIPDNTLLTVNNYYAFVLKYVDTDVTVYGPDTTFLYDNYANGYAWKAEVADNFIDKILGAEGSGDYAHLAFQIFSTQDIYITGYALMADFPPNGDAEVMIYVEDASMKMASILSTDLRGGFGQSVISQDISSRPVLMENGGKFEAVYNDDATDDVTKTLFTMTYLYEPPTTNG